mmetsp:Transcript_6219/g.9687  ORF Transcript_6219/g.9687 Transcript_6219/m.9687 type:complete len:237 (+) Transcript_6219:1817-2527(+)
MEALFCHLDLQVEVLARPNTVTLEHNEGLPHQRRVDVQKQRHVRRPEPRVPPGLHASPRGERDVLVRRRSTALRSHPFLPSEQRSTHALPKFLLIQGIVTITVGLLPRPFGLLKFGLLIACSHQCLRFPPMAPMLASIVDYTHGVATEPLKEHHRYKSEQEKTGGHRRPKHRVDIHPADPAVSQAARRDVLHHLGSEDRFSGENSLHGFRPVIIKGCSDRIELRRVHCNLYQNHRD